MVNLTRPRTKLSLSNELLSALDLLESIESTDSELERRGAVTNLIATNDPESSRILIDLWSKTMWRSTKIDILRAIAQITSRRAVEFLLKVARKTEDLPLASEAILALSSSCDPIAGEFLLDMLSTEDNPLRREAVIALTNMDFFPCEDELSKMLISEPSNSRLIQYVIIALGRRVHQKSWPQIEARLHTDACSNDTMVFNASMAAAGRLGNLDTIDTLKSIDTRYRFFAHQLKDNAIERISLRMGRSVEDAVSAVLNAKDSQSQQEALSFLKEFPWTESWEAFQLLGGLADFNTQCLVRAALLDPNRIDDDIDFIIAHSDQISPDILAALIRGQKREADASFIDEILSRLPINIKISVLDQVRDIGFPRRIVELFEANPNSEIIRTDLINAMTSQALMRSKNSKQRQEVAAAMYNIYNEIAPNKTTRSPSIEENPPEIANRILRALGQIQYDSPAFLIYLSKRLKQNTSSYPSIYAALTSIETQECAQIIIRRLKSIASRDGSNDETAEILRSLSKFEELPSLACLNSLNSKTIQSCKHDILAILSRGKNEHFISLINNSLQDKNYHTQILAISAAKHSHCEATWNLAFGLLSHENRSISIRALDSICNSGGANEHRRLLDWLKENIDSKNTCIKILESLTPKVGDSYESIVSRLNIFIKSNSGAFKDKTVISAAIKLKENINLSRSLQRPSHPGNKPVSPHALDESLSSQIHLYDSYPEVIKAVLRNAELTWQHPELFNEQVDKSTIVIQFTKSIDILMQDRVGSFIFLRPNSPLLAVMQSYVMRLRLDERSITSAQRIVDLDCSAHFESDDFPNHKLSLICSSIMSGKIVKDQYRVIDGLRAWSLLMLMFGRTFKYRGETIKPLLPVNDVPDQKVSRISAQMNALQQIRNRAAHRGTLLAPLQLEQVRQESFEVLNELSKYLKF